MTALNRTQVTLIVALTIAGALSARFGARSPVPGGVPPRPPSAAVAMSTGGQDGVGGSQVPYDPVDRIRLREHLGWLGEHLDLDGSGDPAAASPATASGYLVDQFARLGLLPGAINSYLQRFEASGGIELGDDNRLRIKMRSATYELDGGVDWQPLVISPSRAVEAPVVFFGPGLSRLAAGRRLPDLTGKLALMLLQDSDSSRGAFGGSETGAERRRLPDLILTEIAAEARIAARLGAEALIVVRPPDPHTAESSLLPFHGRTLVNTAPVPVIEVRFDVMQTLLSAHRFDLREASGLIAASGRPHAFERGGLIARLRVDLEPRRAELKNVVGWLRGNDPRFENEVIVVGAPFVERRLAAGLERSARAGLDRAARADVAGARRSALPPDGPGLAALLEVAAATASRRQTLQRSVVFVAFAADQTGDLGSAHYVRRPSRPLVDTQIMISLGTVGTEPDRSLPVVVDGAPDVVSLLATVAEDLAVEPFFSRRAGLGAHTAFQAGGVPFVAFGSRFVRPGGGSGFAATGSETPPLDLYSLERQTRVIAGFLEVLGVRAPRIRSADMSAR